MALYVGVAGATASRLALLSIAVSVTDSFRVSLNGQGAGTLEADVFFSRSTSQGNTANPLSSPGVTVGGSHLDLGIPYLSPCAPMESPGP